MKKGSFKFFVEYMDPEVQLIRTEFPIPFLNPALHTEHEQENYENNGSEMGFEMQRVFPDLPFHNGTCENVLWPRNQAATDGYFVFLKEGCLIKPKESEIL